MYLQTRVTFSRVLSDSVFAAAGDCKKGGGEKNTVAYIGPL
jgi:hypothetical protein